MSNNDFNSSFVARDAANRTLPLLGYMTHTFILDQGLTGLTGQKGEVSSFLYVHYKQKKITFKH